MAFVVTESCIKCKYMDCVEVCPVDCFHEGPNFLVIDPDECIDCTLCEPECPVEAIYFGRRDTGRPRELSQAERRAREEVAGDQREKKTRRRMRSNGKACRRSSSCWSVSRGAGRDSAQRFASIRLSDPPRIGSAIRQLQIFDLLHEFRAAACSRQYSRRAP